MRVGTLVALAALAVISVQGNEQQNKERLLMKACIRNPRLPFCHIPEPDPEPQPEVERTREFIRQDKRVPFSSQGSMLSDRSRDSSLRPQQAETPISPSAVRGPQDLQQLQALCMKFRPIVAQHCGRQDLTKEYVAKCMAFFRDCNQFLTQADPLSSIGSAFTSGVKLNYYNWDVKGIPFYPVNEEGAIGGGHNADIGFGSWGGGYSENVGVRDYWSQKAEYGANWVEGKYGYRNGWSMPLVQSLGIEGGGGTDVNVPIRPDKLGTIDVDNHYGVGGYYKHNQHTGVDWRKGEVKSMFGVGVPFAGVGFNTGTAVAFPSLDTFANSLG